MTLKYLLDSDVFSLMVKGMDTAINQRLAKLPRGEAALSVITAGEFHYGHAHTPLSAIRQQRAQRLLDFFDVLPLSEPAARTYGTLRASLRSRGTPIGPNDFWLAAQALALDLTLVSRNTREFQRVPGLKLQDWA